MLLSKNLKIKNVSKYILIAYFSYITLYFSGSLFSVLSNSSIMTYIFFITTVVMFIYTLMNKRTLFSNSFYGYSFFFLIFLYLYTIIVNWEISNINLYLSYIMYILFSFSMVEILSLNRFIKIFTTIVTILAILSLMNYFLYNFTNLLSFRVLVSENNVNYAKTIFGYIYYGNSLRNLGLFWEPGLFSSFLVMALILKILFLKKISLFSFIIYILVIVTTNSAAGYLCLIPIFIVYFRLLFKQGKNIVVYLCIAFLIVSLYLIFSLDVITVETLNKILNVSISDSRIDSLLFNLEIFSNHPITGIGFYKTSILFEQGINSHVVVAQTSTSTYYLAASGLLGFGYTIIWITSILRIKYLTMFEKIVCIFVFLFIINKEPHYSILATSIMLFYFLKSASKEEYYGKKNIKLH